MQINYLWFMTRTTLTNNAFETIVLRRIWSRLSKNYQYRFSFAEHGKASVMGKEKDFKTVYVISLCE